PALHTNAVGRFPAPECTNRSETWRCRWVTCPDIPSNASYGCEGKCLSGTAGKTSHADQTCEREWGRPPWYAPFPVLLTGYQGSILFSVETLCYSCMTLRSRFTLSLPFSAHPFNHLHPFNSSLTLRNTSCCIIPSCSIFQKSFTSGKSSPHEDHPPPWPSTFLLPPLSCCRRLYHRPRRPSTHRRSSSMGALAPPQQRRVRLHHDRPSPSHLLLGRQGRRRRRLHPPWHFLAGLPRRILPGPLRKRSAESSPCHQPLGCRHRSRLAHKLRCASFARGRCHLQRLFWFYEVIPRQVRRRDAKRIKKRTGAGSALLHRHPQPRRAFPRAFHYRSSPVRHRLNLHQYDIAQPIMLD